MLRVQEKTGGRGAGRKAEIRSKKPTPEIGKGLERIYYVKEDEFCCTTSDKNFVKCINTRTATCNTEDMRSKGI